MPRVICSLPNASDEIDGIRFHPLEDGRKISDEIPDAAAIRYASIPGYEIDEEDSAPVVESAPAPAPKLTKAQKAAAEKAAKEAAKDEVEVESVASETDIAEDEVF